MSGEQYPGNVNTMEAHDLDQETANCQIDEIIAAGHDRPYVTHQAAKSDGYDNEHYCIEGSTR